MKKSGVGRELSEEGFYNYLEVKQIVEYKTPEALYGWYNITPQSKL